jgi:hypothetical protein
MMAWLWLFKAKSIYEMIKMSGFLMEYGSILYEAILSFECQMPLPHQWHRKRRPTLTGKMRKNHCNLFS